MTEQEFRNTIENAKNGDLVALERILGLYEPMIDKYSYLFGQLDEDLRQYILLRIVTGIKGFKI